MKIVVILQKGRPVKFPDSPSVMRVQNGRVYLNRIGAHAFNYMTGRDPQNLMHTRGMYAPPHILNALRSNTNAILQSKHETRPNPPTYHPQNPNLVQWHNVFHDDEDHQWEFSFPEAHEAQFWQQIHKSPELLQDTYNHVHDALVQANKQSGEKGAVLMYPLMPKNYYADPTDMSMQARKNTIRHEEGHKLRNTAIGAANNFLEEKDIHELLSNPLFHRSLLLLAHTGYDGTPAELSEELFVRLTAGQGKNLGLDRGESAQILNEIINRLHMRHGDKLHDMLRASAPSIRRGLYGKTNSNFPGQTTTKSIIVVRCKAKTGILELGRSECQFYGTGIQRRRHRSAQGRGRRNL